MCSTKATGGIFYSSSVSVSSVQSENMANWTASNVEGGEPSAFQFVPCRWRAVSAGSTSGTVRRGIAEARGQTSETMSGPGNEVLQT